MATHPTRSGRPGGDDGDADLPPEVIEDLLGAPARRRLLARLREEGTPVAVDDLAALLAAGSVDGDVPTDRRRAARNEIYQDHLPKLTATGAVTFDSMLGTVEFTGNQALAERLDDRKSERR